MTQPTTGRESRTASPGNSLLPLLRELQRPGVIDALVSLMEAGTLQQPPQRLQHRWQADSGAWPRTCSSGWGPGAGAGMPPPRTEEQHSIAFLERHNEELLDIIRGLRNDIAPQQAPGSRRRPHRGLCRAQPEGQREPRGLLQSEEKVVKNMGSSADTS